MGIPCWKEVHPAGTWYDKPKEMTRINLWGIKTETNIFFKRTIDDVQSNEDSNEKYRAQVNKITANIIDASYYK